MKNTTLYISSCPSLWFFKKSGGYFHSFRAVSLLDRVKNHSKRCKHHSKSTNFNLKERKTTRKRVAPHMALQRVPFHSFAFREYLVRASFNFVHLHKIFLLLLVAFVGNLIRLCCLHRFSRQMSSQFNHQAILFLAKSNATEKGHSISFYDKSNVMLSQSGPFDAHIKP